MSSTKPKMRDVNELSQDVLNDLAKSGISPQTIQNMGVLPVTEEHFNTYLHRKLIDPATQKPLIESGYILPYPNISEKFGRVKIFSAPLLGKNGDCPRYLSPSKESDVESTTHLYILPPDAERLRSPKTIFIFVEGEKKAAKLSQEFRAIEDEFTKYAVIGGSGVQQFLTSPEMETLQLQERIIYLCFDADSLVNVEVAKAELKLAAFCMMKGCQSVISMHWEISPETKGIDDLLVTLAQKTDHDLKVALAHLKNTALSPFEKYKHLSVETMCGTIGKLTGLHDIHIDNIAKQLGNIFPDIRVHSIRKRIQDALQYHREQELQQKMEKNRQLVQKTFKISYVPEMPEGFLFRDGKLIHGTSGLILCNMFVLHSCIKPTDNTSEAIYLLRFQKEQKEIWVSSDDYSDKTKLAKIFNRNREMIDPQKAGYIQRYISDFWQKNEDNKNLPILPYYTSTGWTDKFETFRLPALCPDARFDQSIESEFSQAGTPEAQTDFLKSVLLQHNAGIFIILGMAAPLLALRKMPRYVVNVWGKSGGGKTTAIQVAMSLYGDPDKLTYSMNTTKVGQEITFAVNKDLPILLDEVQTAGNSRNFTKTLLDLIYGFAHGKGRTRATINLKRGEMLSYRGIVIMTSERSLESMLSTAEITTGGAYRRTLQFPLIKDGTFWNLETQFRDIHANINTNFGHVGPAWIKHITQPAIQERLFKRYEEEMQHLEKGLLRGTEHIFSLLFAVIEEAEKFFNLPTDSIMTRLADYFDTVIAEQRLSVNRNVSNLKEKFVENLRNFIASRYAKFVTVSTNEKNEDTENLRGMGIDGKIEREILEDGREQEHIYVTTGAFEEFCQQYQFEKQVLIDELKQVKILQTYKKSKDGNYYDAVTGQSRIFGTRYVVYHFINVDDGN